ncbi:hypothetical protein EVG59_17550 [Salmonella enterica subsp. enterica serovar Dortmund]|nr:hypothetical protein [Salmonella enterica subsp. enterica serovar Dortmund]ECA8971980.1 hypothetical protein [Salmonella enterica subsp. enterica serovar Omuna]ECB1961014.1 hypothetical protein [Salmonella enterica subsp. enterica serovar Dortmund]ECE0501439.1 hypothetical protein [Salmonella enterica subsp. enterica]ECI6123889.1 hypothetical protein [Salmonella enterica subsp. enterica]
MLVFSVLKMQMYLFIFIKIIGLNLFYINKESMIAEMKALQLKKICNAQRKVKGWRWSTPTPF